MLTSMTGNWCCLLVGTSAGVVSQDIDKRPLALAAWPPQTRWLVFKNERPKRTICKSAWYFFKILFTYFQREGGRGERNINRREKHQSDASSTCNWGPNPQLRHEPWPEIKLVTFCFVDDDQPTEPHWSGQSAWYFYDLASEVTYSISDGVPKLSLYLRRRNQAHLLTGVLVSYCKKNMWDEILWQPPLENTVGHKPHTLIQTPTLMHTTYTSRLIHPVHRHV